MKDISYLTTNKLVGTYGKEVPQNKIEIPLTKEFLNTILKKSDLFI